MIRGKDNILKWFELQNKPYYSIFRKGQEASGNFVFSNRDKEDQDISSANDSLNFSLSLISNGEYFIYCSDKKDASSKGRSETHFAISINETAAPAAAQISGTGGGAFDYETMMSKAREMATEQFEKLQLKSELANAKEKLKEVEKDNKDLQQKINAPWTKVIDQIHPYVGSIAEQLGFKKSGQAFQVSALPADESLVDNEITPDQAENMNKVVHDFCEALQEYSPDQWLVIMARLTAAIKADPKKIEMALTFL